MIQRIQTLFLLGASALLFSLFFSVFAYSPGMEIKYMEYRPFMIFTIVSTIITFATIFLYKNRMLQIRLCIYDLIILAAYQIWIIYALVKSWGEMAFSFTSIFPLVAGLLTLLALKFISRDEAMVRASSSLRSLSKRRKRG